ncbi:putative signal peptide-containing protein [Cryptosporidium canis]|uniref:Signal peptide-containing protein n=1 Tax=Cryptosporidium canis TaxID=195482 RepID=A0A9D5DFB8_9CRYT|nr:putative signal peptide-containing protein [Cryptosporidium canis]
MNKKVLVSILVGLLSITFVQGATVQSQFFNPLAIFSGIGSMFSGITKGIQNIFETFIKEIIPSPVLVDPKYDIRRITSVQQDILKNMPILENDLNAVGEVVNEMAVGASINAAKGLQITQSVLKPDMSGASETLRNLKSVNTDDKKKSLKSAAKAKSREFLESLSKPSEIVSDYTAPIIVIQAPDTDPTQLMTINDIIKCRGGKNWITTQEHMLKMKEYKKLKGKKKKLLDEEINHIHELLEEKDSIMTDLRNKLRASEVKMVERPSDVATLENKLLSQQMGYLAEEIVLLDKQLEKLQRKKDD